MRSFILVALPLASAMIHDISVGKGGLRYDPEMLTVAKDDTLRFHFYSEHNVAQSSFDKPCQPIDKGLFSGTIEAKGMTESDQVWDVKVNNTDPIWIYCSYENHCQAGMAMAVNPGPNQKLSDYKTAATKARVMQPPAVEGGVFMDAKAAVANSSSFSSASGSMSGMSASGAARSMSSMASSMSMTSAPASTTASATAAASPASTSGAAACLKADGVGWMGALGLGGAVVAGLV